MCYEEEFGLMVRKYREKKKLSREQLAEMCKISTRCISNIERGVAEPKLGTALRICYICGINTGELRTTTD